MAKRVILAGILGGVVMFLWGGLWHDALPTAFLGLRSLPNEATVRGVMEANVHEPGMYLFPGFGVPDDAPFSEKKAGMQKVVQSGIQGPTGVLIYNPGGTGLTAKMLVTECVTDVLQALLVAFLLAQIGVKRFASRLGFAFVVGIVAAITTNISLWNFYRFPASWVVGQITYLVLGYFLIGLVVAAIVKTGVPKAGAATA